MIIKFVALSALTVAGVGTVIALNPPEVRPDSANRGSVSVSTQTPTSAPEGTDGPAADQMQSPRRDGNGPGRHDRPRYVPPHALSPGAPVFPNDDEDFEGDWSEHDGWHGGWDDDVRQPRSHESPRSQTDDDQEQEDGR